jgi:repressor LexA
MDELTQRQKEILDFLRTHEREQGTVPSLRDVARCFGFRSMTAAADHIRALRRKGYLAHQPRRARSHRVISPLDSLRRPLVEIPFFGSIPAGRAEAREQEADGCVSIDTDSLGIPASARLFALRVRGDSMVGRHILDGDTAIIRHGPQPRPGDVVAALIDGESTLKTFVRERGLAFLRAENPRYPDLIPADELSIQGILIALIRKCR